MAPDKSPLTEVHSSALEERLNHIESLLPKLESELLTLQDKGYRTLTKSNAFDLVTEADLHSEQVLIGAIQESFPKDAILSEESQENGQGQITDGITWVIDPIDGTVNYANGLHHWGVSVGICYKQKPVAGIVSAPALNLKYRAILGNGATKNGRPISVSDKKALKQGVVCTGFPYDRAHRAEPLSRALANMLRVAGGVRRLGAASLDFCQLADSTLLGYYEMQLKPWDMAAGLIIAEEAGAKISDFNGKPVNLMKSHGVVVANPTIHEELLPLTAPMLDAIAAY